MLNWAIAFFIIANISGVIAFTNLAGNASATAEILFFVFLILFVACLLFGRRSPPTSEK